MPEKDKITTIKLSSTTKSRLDKLKAHKRDSYDDILQRLLGILNICTINPEKSRSRLAQINRQNRKLRQK
tara:strand:+ start:3867 stop:4076 length:210 start_codon:yes stop_codon:yes gene_type:complete